MPSIFHCNINQYIRNDSLTVNSHSITSNSDPFGDIADDTNRLEWIQTYEAETHTNQLLIEQISDLNTDHIKTPEFQSADIVEPISHLFQQHEVTNPAIVNVSTPDNEYDSAINATDDMDDCIYLNKTESFDYIEPFCLINTISPRYKATDIVYGVEEKSDTIADSEDCATLVDIIQAECVDDSTRSIEKLNGSYDVTCRLCANTFDTDIGLIKIFSEDSDRLIGSINSIMPNIVSVG